MRHHVSLAWRVKLHIPKPMKQSDQLHLGSAFGKCILDSLLTVGQGLWLHDHVMMSGLHKEGQALDVCMCIKC